MSSIGSYLESVFSLEGKIILMTGAAGGLGAAMAEALAKAGGTVLIGDLDRSPAKELAQKMRDEGLKAKAYDLDVTSVEQIKACVDAVIAEFGRIDVLINVAGINRREGLLDVAESTYDRIMNVNLKGVFMMSQEVGKHMFQQRSGNIINIGSHNDEDMLGGCSVYGASKSGVRALTRSMAVEWAQYGIRANCISPGHFLTPLSQVTWDHPTRSVWLRDRIAMRRPGEPSELIGMVLLLASDASSYMTGQAYHVDGGCLVGGSPWNFDTAYHIEDEEQ